ncbi:MAG TPA: hemerythrin domain-containing protein [Polyangiaceae bacterium]
MSSASQSTLSGLCAALTFDHARIETCGRHALSLLHCSEQDECRASWFIFRKHLFAHLDAEEKWILPAFDAARPEACAAVRSGHAEIKRAMATVSASLASGTADEHAMREVLDLLISQCQLEERELYPWSETAIDPTHSRAVLEQLEPVNREEDGT